MYQNTKYQNKESRIFDVHTLNVYLLLTAHISMNYVALIQVYSVY